MLIFSFIFQQNCFSQLSPGPVVPAYLAGQLPADRFRPIHLRSISYEAATNNIGLILDMGDNKNLSVSQLEDETQQLFQYFQIGLVLPNEMFWVNLRPDEPSNVIAPCLEKTDIGKVLLEADLQLKKDMAACTSPDTREGRVYWNKLYAKAQELFGQSDIEIPTITRPWIVPAEIIMAQSHESAYIYKATLKVLLEQDYVSRPAIGSLTAASHDSLSSVVVKGTQANNPADARFKELNEYSSQILREEILPRLTKEVNSSRKYAALRQVYYSLILAQWYKQARPQTFAAQIDSMNLDGLVSRQKWSKDAYYLQYRKSFEQGEYIKEETVYTKAGLSIRRYFSGGIKMSIANPEGLILTPL